MARHHGYSKREKLTVILAAILFCATTCSKTPAIGGEWKMGGPYNVGESCLIAQDGQTLTFVNEHGDKSKGNFKDNTTLVATD